MARILGISKAASDAAAAADSPLLMVPEGLAQSKDLKNGDTEHRWSERATIKKAVVQDDKNNPDRTVFYVQLQVQPGSINKAKPIFARHYVNFTSLMTEGDETDSFMNLRSISSLKSLVRATGQYIGADGDIPAETLQAMFPTEESGQKSTILGKRVSVTIVDRAIKPKGDDQLDLTKRAQNVESYAPDA